MTTSFMEQMRAKAEPGFLWRDLKHIVGAVLLFIWGIYAIAESEGTGNQIVSVLLIVGGIAWGIYAIRRWRTRSSLATHPFGVTLASLGDRTAIMQAVDQDFAGRTADALPLQVGKRFICFARKAQVAVIPFDHIVWVYGEVVRHSVNMIPTGKSYQVVVWKRDGTAENLPVTKSQLDQCIRRLSEAAPWLPVGTSDVLTETWNADRNDFIAMVDAQRAQAAKA